MHMKMLKRIILFFVFTCIIYHISYCQDPNLSHIDDLSKYELRYDSVQNYYSDINYKYDDNIFGIAQWNYFGPDSLSGYAAYYTQAPYKNGRQLRKGLAIGVLPGGTFYGISYYDWSGDLHGNDLHFYPNGALKLNEIWDRGTLIKSWEYSENGELIEYKEYK